eukprot:6620057-Prymnesium_polylepis.1
MGRSRRRRRLATAPSSSGDVRADPVRHTTFKLLAARGCVTGRRVRQFDVEGAYLKGIFAANEIVYARPPPNFPGGR